MTDLDVTRILRGNFNSFKVGYSYLVLYLKSFFATLINFSKYFKVIFVLVVRKSVCSMIIEHFNVQ